MFRLDQEKDTCAFYFWLTLQYDDEHVPMIQSFETIEEEDQFGFPVKRTIPGLLEMCFSKEHCHMFFEKLRKRYKKQGIKFKHFLVAEYGPNATHRPHYHCLLLVYNDLTLAQNYTVRKEMREFILDKAWPHGHVTEKTFHGRVLRYLTKYCMKPELLGQKHEMKTFTLISKGIGMAFLDNLPPEHLEQMQSKLDLTYRYGTSKIQLPRYYTDKIVPHSLQNLRDAAIAEDWETYQRITDIRNRLNKRYSALSRQHAKETENLSYDERQNRINYEMAKFKAIVKLRKDL